MKKTFISASMMSTFFLIACSSNNSPQTDPSILPEKKAAATVPVNANNTNPLNNNTAIKIDTGTVSSGTISNAKTITASDAANILPGAGLNPAHGLPGHRCDIAVGMPLNSPATNAAAKPPVQTITAPAGSPKTSVTTTPIINAGATRNAKLNPAHGQPGHDCSVSVGAPLKN